LAEVARDFIADGLNKEIKVNFRMVLRFSALAAACFFSIAGVRAQSTPAAGASVAGKVGVINVRAAIGNTAEGKQASAELQSKYAPRQTEIENLTKQITDLQQRLDACRGKCSAEEEDRLTKQGQRLTQQLDRKRNEFQEDVNVEQSDIIDRIGRKMVDVLERYSRENGYAVVLDTSAQNTPIMYASNQIDVTQDIIRLYDQAYPVKAGATTSTPARPAQVTPKPAAQPPAAAKP